VRVCFIEFVVSLSVCLVCGVRLCASFGIGNFMRHEWILCVRVRYFVFCVVRVEVCAGIFWCVYVCVSM